MKFLCSCGKLATYCYMPSSENNPYYCYNCVPRGCSCNHECTPEIDSVIGSYPTTGQRVKWIEENKYWTPLDENGKEFPCCEYFEDKDGYDANSIEDYEKDGIQIKYK